MSDFIALFNSDKAMIDDILSTPKSSSLVKKFKIVDCMLENRVAKSGQTYTHFVFKLSYDKTKTIEVTQIVNLTDKQGNPIERLELARPGNWSDKQGRGYPATLAYEISQAIKAELGEEKYEERKLKAGGLGRKFFKNCEFDFEVLEGNKDGKEWLIVQTQKSKLDYLVKKGDEPKDKRGFEKRILNLDNTEMVEQVLGSASTLNIDDLPF